MTNKVSRIAIICALEETIRDEVRRMCDTDSLAELDTMALHAKENIENLRSVKYKTLVKGSTEVVKDLVKADRKTEPQTNADQYVQRIKYVESVERSRCRKCKHFKREYETPVSSDGRYYTYITCSATKCVYEPKTEPSADNLSPVDNSNCSEIPTGSERSSECI